MRVKHASNVTYLSSIQQICVKYYENMCKD